VGASSTYFDSTSGEVCLYICGAIYREAQTPPHSIIKKKFFYHNLKEISSTVEQPFYTRKAMSSNLLFLTRLVRYDFAPRLDKMRLKKRYNKLKYKSKTRCPGYARRTALDVLTAGLRALYIISTWDI
jgi:hypothetical protein